MIMGEKVIRTKPWKSKTKQRMVLRMIHVKDSLLPMGKVWSLDFLGKHFQQKKIFQTTHGRRDTTLCPATQVHRLDLLLYYNPSVERICLFQFFCWWYTLPETNIAPARKPSQKETSLPTIDFSPVFSGLGPLFTVGYVDLFLVIFQ